MPVPPLSEPTGKHQYSLYELVHQHKAYMGGFDMLTGGEQGVSMISYSVIDPNGNVTTRYMPGQTKYSAVSLLRAVDKGAKEIYLKFLDSVDGKLKKSRQHYSVSMNDTQGKPVVWWDLINAIPTKISGFNFNEHTESEYTDFTVDIQAETIIMRFVAPEAPPDK